MDKKKKCDREETTNTSNSNKKSKGEDNIDTLRQENEDQRQEIECQRQEIERKNHKIKRQHHENKLLRHHFKCHKIGYCAKCTQANCMNGRHSDSLPCKHCGEDFRRGKSTLRKTIDLLQGLPPPKVLDRNEANQWIKDVPEELWVGEIMPYFSLKELSLGGTIAKHFQKYWFTFKSKREWCVPKDFSSLGQALRVGEILSRRGIISSTNENLFKIMLSNGVHDYYGQFVDINIPISIIGESREHCIVIGGLLMNGNEEDEVNVSSLTLRESKESGIYGNKGASFHLDNVSVENSGYDGVSVWMTKRNTMKNCNVSHSKDSGVSVQRGGLMTIDGNGTTIHHNCTDGNSWDYGLDAYKSSSSIHLVSPLTLETVSTNNNGSGGSGGSHGGNGTIKSVDKDGKVLKVVYEGRPDEDNEEDDY